MKDRLIVSSKLKNILRVISAFVFLAVLALFLFKTRIVNSIVNKQLRKMEEKTGWLITYTELRLSGISQLDARDFSIINRNLDTIASLGSATIRVNLFYWLNGGSLIKSAEFDNGNVAVNNLLTKSKQDSDTTRKVKRDGSMLLELQEIYRNQVRRFLPGDIEATNISISYRDSLGPVVLSLQRITTEKDSLDGLVLIRDSTREQAWRFSGYKKEGIQLHMEPLSGNSIPVINSRAGADLKFASVDVNVQFPREKDHSVVLSGSCKGFSFYHPKISSDTIVFNSLSGSLPLLINSDGIQADSGAAFGINHIRGKFSFSFPVNPLKPVYKLHVYGEWVDAGSFFASLPIGAFDDTRGLKATGSLRYLLDFELDGRVPDSVIFNSTLERKDFRLDPRSSASLGIMNGSFFHQVFENGRQVRIIQVGPENPSFTYFEDVPKTLVNSILTAEDPSFFYHNGFIQEAFRESIAENYRAGKFKRGGSTISMQLVKNVFLSRKKTVFRKIEEAMIVWLLENQRITSKQRMMEVYLNIIEWGPGIYGIGEASAYYFKKKPAQLTLQECLFLANIIPRPKNFRYCFDAEGNLRSFMDEQCRFIMRRMASRELLSEQDTTGFSMDLKLTGPAKSLIVPEVSNTDSLGLEMPFLPDVAE